MFVCIRSHILTVHAGHPSYSRTRSTLFVSTKLAKTNSQHVPRSLRAISHLLRAPPLRPVRQEALAALSTSSCTITRCLPSSLCTRLSRLFWRSQMRRAKRVMRLGTLPRVPRLARPPHSSVDPLSRTRRASRNPGDGVLEMRSGAGAGAEDETDVNSADAELLLANSLRFHLRAPPPAVANQLTAVQVSSAPSTPPDAEPTAATTRPRGARISMSCVTYQGQRCGAQAHRCAHDARFRPV